VIQLSGYPIASFHGAQTALDPELEAMLHKTLYPGEAVFLKVQSALGEALVVTRDRIIVLKGASRDPAGRGYGRYFALDGIIRFECRGWIKTNFIAVITTDTKDEVIPLFGAWRCSFGTTFTDLGNATASYLRGLEGWIASQRRAMLLQGPLQPIVVSGIASHPGESFFLAVYAKYFEEKDYREYVGSSSGVSIPVGGGVRMRVRGSRGRSVTRSVLQEDDHGLLAIGDQRIVFSGQRRSISIPLRTIVAVQAFRDGVQVSIGNKKVNQFRTRDDLPGLLLKRLLQIP
jgi:hypothetical protein